MKNEIMKKMKGEGYEIEVGFEEKAIIFNHYYHNANNVSFLHKKGY